MSEDRVKELLSELLNELQQTDGVDVELLVTVKQLETDVAELINPEMASEENTALDDAIALEASFAVSHPVAEKLIRELINSLSRIGI